MIENLLQDLRYGVRSLRKHALLSIAVVLTLTLSIGISTGVFTLINAGVLRPRVDKDPNSFLRIFSSYTIDPARPGPPGETTLEDYLAFREGTRALHDLTAWAQFEAPLDQKDQSEARALLVTCNFFSLYNLERPRLGRLLKPEDCSTLNPVIVLSEGLWRNRYASDPQIVGKVIHFNGQPVTVVGVTPVFAGQINGANAWSPYTLQPYLKLGQDLLNTTDGHLPNVSWLIVEGRLNPGFSRQDAAAELTLLAAQQDQLHPGRKTRLTVTDGSWLQHPEWRNVLIWVVSLTMGVLFLLVLIACANVTTLLISRAAARQQEIAVRLALGAGKMRLIRMLLMETLLLAFTAGLASLYLAYHIPHILNSRLVDRPFEFTLDPDWRVFSYLAAITLLAGILAGLAPALQSQ